MSTGSLPRLIVFGDPRKGAVAQTIEEFTGFSKGKADIVADYELGRPSREKISAKLPKADFAVVFGGDGSIIAAARYLNESNLAVPVIGVNLGKLGFLAEFSVGELKELFDDIISGKAGIEKRMLLGCRVFSEGQEKFFSSAVNDVFISAGPPFGMIELKIMVDDQPLAGCVSDGLVICTPTGSTAYNLSAGGPILSGKMEAMVITAICPHSLSFRPIVINADSTVAVSGVHLNEGTTLAVDGQIPVKLSVGDIVKVERQKNDFLIVNNPARTQWDTLANKLKWAKKLTPEH